MNKTELEEAIKNGESVWCVNSALKEIIELKLNKNYILYSNSLQNKINCLHYFLNELYKTKAEAEHYLNHANITHTETLPFLTWEEFLEKQQIIFTGKDKKEYCLFIEFNQIKIFDKSDFKYIFRECLTEENFYKAYDKCVKLFKGEEI